MFIKLSKTQSSNPNLRCRTCLKSSQEFYFICAAHSNPVEDFLRSLKCLVPEMHLNLSVKPAICMPCYKLLHQAYNFRIQCLQSEKLISIYMKETHTPVGLVQLHKVVEYCKGVFKSKSSNPCQSETSLTNDVSEWFESNDANDDKPESENVEQSKKELTTNKSQLAAKEAQPESDISETDLSELNTGKKKIFIRPRLSYINKQLKNKPGTSENNDTTLSAEPELDTNRAHTATSATLNAGKSTEDFISTSKIAPACEKYLTKTGDKGFRVRNDLLNQAVNHTVANIMKDTGKKLERPKPAPARKHVIIKKMVTKAKERPLDQSGKDGNIMKETRIIIPAAPPLLPLVPGTSLAPKLLPAPHIAVNINYTPKNTEMDNEMLKVLQNNNLFREHVRNNVSGQRTFIVRKIVNRNNKLLGYSVDIGNNAESESDGSRQKFVVNFDKVNTPSDPLLTEVDLQNMRETENNQESLGSNSETSSTETSPTVMANIPSAPLTEVNPESLPDTGSLGLKSGISSSKLSSAAMPRIRVRPESSLKKIRTLNHELFPQISHLPSTKTHHNFRELAAPGKVAQSHKDSFGFSHLQDTSAPLMEVTKIHLNPHKTSHVPFRLNQYSDGTKQTPFVLNSMVARQKAPSPRLELSNAPIIPGLVPVTKEHLKQMGIESICIKRLPPSYNPPRILPVNEEIRMAGEPPEYFNEEQYLRAIEKENAFVQNDLQDAPSYTSTKILPAGKEMSVGVEPPEDFNQEEPLIAVKNEPTFVEDDIDIKEEPLSYDEDDVSRQGFESIDSVFANESTNSSQTSLNDNLPEHIDVNSNPSNESTISASENSLDDETLHGLLDITEIEEYDTPEYIHINKMDAEELVEFGTGAKKQKKKLKCTDLENPARSNKIPAPKVGRQRKRFRLVRVDSGDEPPKKKRIVKTKPAVTRINPLDDNICTAFTKFTSEGDYVNDHDYLVSPYERYGMTEFPTNRHRCLLCDHALPVEEHVKHMQCHSTYCHICRVNFNNVFLLNFHVRQHIYRCPDCNINVTYARYAHHAETHKASRRLKNIDSVCDATNTTTAIRRRSCTVTRAIEEDGKQPTTATATNENQLQSEEAPNANPISFDEVRLSDLLESPNDTNVNSVSTASPSINLDTKKRRRPQPKRRTRKRKIGIKIDQSQKNELMVQNKVEDKAGMCEVSQSDMPENIIEKEAMRGIPESDAVAESNTTVSNVLQIKETNPKQAIEIQTDTLACNKVHRLENFKGEGDVTNSSTSQRRTRNLRSSNTPSPSRINRLKEERRYPSRTSVVATDLNIPLSSIKSVNTESETSSNVATSSDIVKQEIVNNDQSRSELLASEEKCLNPFAVINLKKKDMENDSLSQKMLPENIPLNKRSGSDNTEDSMAISEEKSQTLVKIESTETTKDISRDTRASQSSGNEMSSCKIKTWRSRIAPETIDSAVNEVLNYGESFRSVAKKYSISVMTLHRYCRKIKEGNNGEQTQANLDTAAKEVLNGESVGIVADKYSINFTTLYRYCQKMNNGKGKQTQTKRKKTKSRKPVVLEDGSYDVDDACCLVCSREYSKSKPGEEWIRCTKCHGWAHEKCVNADTYFVCQKCVVNV